MKRPTSFLTSAAFGLLVVAVGGGCNFGQDGIAPPTNRIFLPAGVVADTDDDFLYVVNSNSDLRFNAGTVVAADLAQAALVRSCAWAASAGAPLPDACLAAPDPALQNPRPMCTKTRFSRTEPVPDDYCCWDMLDSNIINCNEPQFVQSDATVQIGSFGGAIQLQRYLRDRSGEIVRRLFVAVRAEPSITYIDATVAQTNNPDRSTSNKVSMRCTGKPRQSGTQPINAFCDDDWKVRRPGGVTPGALVLPEEPHVLAYDDTLQALYVGHLTVVANAQVQGGGVSTIDVSKPQDESSEVRFAGLARWTFLPASLPQAVATLLSPSDSSNLYPAEQRHLFATARYSTAISEMVLRDPTQQTDSPPGRDLTLIPSEQFYSSAFAPNGADIRGILFWQPDKVTGIPTQAFVLHRNDANSLASPSAIVLLDRRPLADGTPANTPMDILEVCGGPTAMQMHNAGRGNRIYVTCYDEGQIYVVDPVEFVVTSIIDVGAGPISLVMTDRTPGVAYVASFANSHLSVIDLLPGSPTENHVVMRIGLPHGYGE
jgi:DNA-binding beta-propeller fold protein YncE